MNIDVRSPFPFDQLPRIYRWIQTFRGKVSDDFGPQSLEGFMEFAGAKWDQQKTWAISVDGELGGLITFERLSPWLGTAHWIFKPDFQGKGIAVKASRIAIAEMFAEGIGKLAVYPLEGNKAIGSLLTSLGAKREGTLIEQTLCGGKPTDIWVFGLTKKQFDERSGHNDAEEEKARLAELAWRERKDKQHALDGTRRRNIIDDRVVPGREAEDDNHDPDVLPGNAGAPEEAPGVLARDDGRDGAGSAVGAQPN